MVDKQPQQFSNTEQYENVRSPGRLQRLNASVQ
jgi:hypothetical protein